MIDPRAHDEAEAQLYEDYAKAEARLSSHVDRMHAMVRDRKDYVGRTPAWRMTGGQVIDQLKAAVAMGDERDLSHPMKPSEAMARESELRTEVAKVMLAIADAAAVYRD